MARVVGDIAVRVGADVSPLQRNMRSGSRSLDTFSTNATRMGENVAKAGKVVVTAMAAIATGVLAAANAAAQAGVEVRNLAAVSGTGTTQFQKMAAAAASVGIEQEKLADILKDVNDKVGDFIETGAGPMADFFENIAPKVGVTADQFARLSGPEALQLYVTSLEKAGASQQQMTFYMEAIASDATALVPILQDGGRAMKELGDEAERSGRILSEDAIDGAVELDRELRVLTSTLRTQATAAVLEHKDELILMVNFITNTLIPALSTLTGALGTVALGWKTIAEEAQKAVGPLTRALGLSDQLQTAGTESPENAAARQADIDRTNAMGGDASTTGTFGVDPLTGEIVEFGANGPTEGIVPKVYSGRGGAGGPGAEEAQEAFVTARAEAFEALQEANAEVEKEEEAHASRVKATREKSAEELAAIDERARRAKFASLSGAFGDLSSLMSSENEKLFKIGKAAAIAEATVSGYYSATKAWEGGLRFSGGNPAVAAAYTAASLAKTGMLINRIASVSASGGGGGSSGGGGGSVGGGNAGAIAAPEASAPRQDRSLTLIGDSFNRKQALKIATFMNDGTDDGLVIRGR